MNAIFSIGDKTVQLKSENHAVNAEMVFRSNIWIIIVYSSSATVYAHRISANGCCDFNNKLKIIFSNFRAKILIFHLNRLSFCFWLKSKSIRSIDGKKNLNIKFLWKTLTQISVSFKSFSIAETESCELNGMEWNETIAQLFSFQTMTFRIQFFKPTKKFASVRNIDISVNSIDIIHQDIVCNL